MKIGDKVFENYTYIMAIINLTPDSFFPNSRATCDDVLFRAERAVKDGAAILDLGAQSTRPSYTEVSAEEEIARLEKPLCEIKRNLGVPVSVDTYFSRCARFALDAGADMINDVWGLAHDGDMAETIAAKSASVCIMHNCQSPLSGDVFPQITSFLSKQVQKALSAGIPQDKICLDGGIGFSKSKEQNWQLLNDYDKLSALGYPLLLGTSRKSMFGGNVEDRLPATLQSTRLAARKRVLFVRVHDVKENFQAVREVYENG